LTNKFGNFFKRKQEWKLSGVLNLILPPLKDYKEKIFHGGERLDL
jgi:hypothetical protein